MRWGTTALMLALMTASAQAQVNGMINPTTNANMALGRHADTDGQKGKGEQKVKANDRAYSSALKNLPDKPYDPWHGVR